MSRSPRLSITPKRALSVVGPVTLIGVVAAIGVPDLGRGPTPAVAAQASAPDLSEGAPEPSGPGEASIVSVDGPGLITVKMQKRTLRVRLTAIDSPSRATAGAPAECGAAEAEAALTRMVRGRLLFVELSRDALAATETEAPEVRTTDGRVVANVAAIPPGRHDGETNALSARLVKSGFARTGQPTSGTDTPIAGGLSALGASAPLDEASLTDLNERAAIAGKGIWGLCRGRFHHPGGRPLPALQPAPWAVDDKGVVGRIGEVAVKAGATLATYIDAYPDAELTTAGFACYLWAPEHGLAVTALHPSMLEEDGEYPTGDLDCGTQVVVGLTTIGRGVPTTAGPATGERTKTFTAAFPDAEVRRADPTDRRSEKGLALGPVQKRAGGRGSVTGTLGADRKTVVALTAYPALP